ncbi:hypothetical protein PHMEG_00014900 [Phytophthora megakarya]|uniref:Retrotransposon gag domain-containing protein n=1 Tax=Phytophthora megakarya TaxID=4795 RepID=A0A225W3P3_9STRA|nr:hypothetical protein PHMEG_00014900 [Phytophthora megakarya]
MTQIQETISNLELKQQAATMRQQTEFKARLAQHEAELVREKVEAAERERRMEEKILRMMQQNSKAEHVGSSEFIQKLDPMPNPNPRSILKHSDGKQSERDTNSPKLSSSKAKVQEHLDAEARRNADKTTGLRKSNAEAMSALRTESATAVTALQAELQSTQADRDAMHVGLRAMKTERDQERKEAHKFQTLLVKDMRNLRVTSPQVQAAEAVSERDPLTRNSTVFGRNLWNSIVFGEEYGRTDVQNLSSTDQTSFSIRDGAGMRRATKSADGIFAAQSQATLSDGKSKVEVRNAKNVETEVVKSEAKVQTATGSSKTPSGRKTGIKPPSKSENPPKGDKRTSDRKDGSKKKSRQNDNPPEDDPDEDPDSDGSRLDDNASSDSDSSAFGDITPSVPVTSIMQQGTTLFSFDPFVNANSLDDFNEKASLSDRIRWLEKFQSMTISGGWSDKTKVYQLKLKLSSTVRDWRSSLRTDTRRDWKKFLKAFRGNYGKARTTDSEKYYTMAQRKSETLREFYYHKTAAKAGIDIRSTSKLRDQHVKTFIRKLTDKQLRATLQGQRIWSMTDLEFILKQHDET